MRFSVPSLSDSRTFLDVRGRVISFFSFNPNILRKESQRRTTTLGSFSSFDWSSSRRAFNKERKIKSDEHSRTIILMFCAYLVVQSRIISTADVYLRHGLKIIILI